MICFLLLLPFGVASLAGLLWARACFRGSCRIVGPCGLLLRLLGLGASSGVVGAGFGVAISSASLETWRSPTSATPLPGYAFARQGSSWWSPLSGEASSQVQDLLLFGHHSLAHGCGDCWWCHDEAH